MIIRKLRSDKFYSFLSAGKGGRECNAHCGILLSLPHLDSGLHVLTWVRHFCFRIFVHVKDFLFHIRDSFTDLLVSVVFFSFHFHNG